MPRKTTGLSVGFLFDDSLDSPTGVAQYVKTLGAWLSSQGHKVYYLVGQTKIENWQGGPVYSLSKNVNVTFNGNRLSIPLPANRRRLRQLLAGLDLDVLHVQMPYSPFLAGRIISLVPQSVAVVGTFHILPLNWLAEYGTHLLKWINWRTLRRFDAAVSVTPPAARFAAKRFGLGLKVITNCANLKSAKALKPGNAKAPRIVFLGRLVERKGCAQLIEAVNLLPSRHPNQNFELIIAGDGPQRHKLQNITNKLAIAPKIKFLGYVIETEKYNLLASADIACFPALAGESFGIVLLEAMAAGSRVVLAGDNPGYRNLFKGRSELLFDPRNSEEFCDRLAKYLKPTASAVRLHAWQKELVKTYDVDTIGQLWLRQYH